MTPTEQLSSDTARVLTFAAAVGLAMVHVAAGRLQIVEELRLRGWLSFGGGVSVSYVFLSLLPELGERHWELLRSGDPAYVFVKNEVYLIALAGMIAFYGLEQAVRRSAPAGPQNAEGVPSAPVFWLHTGSFAVYNTTIGYLLVDKVGLTARGMGLFFVAMFLHFVVNDFGLRRLHRANYDARAKWLLAAAVLVGWGVGQAIEIPEHVLAVPTSFLAGGVVLNVLKEELPAEREGSFMAFLLGAFVYALILLLR